MIFSIILAIILAMLIVAVYIFYRAVQAQFKKNSEDHHLLSNNDSLLLQEIGKMTVLHNKVNDECIRILKILNTIKNDKHSNSTVYKELERAEAEVRSLSTINKSLLNEIASIKRHVNKISEE